MTTTTKAKVYFPNWLPRLTQPKGKRILYFELSSLYYDYRQGAKETMQSKMKIPTKTPSELHYVNKLDNLVGSVVRTNQLLSVRMRNFSPVVRDEIPKNKIVRNRSYFVKKEVSFRPPELSVHIHMVKLFSWLLI